MKLRTCSLKLTASHLLKKRLTVSYLYSSPLLVFMQEFDLNQDGKVSWEEFQKAMASMKEKMDGKAEGAKEYKSFSKLKDDRFKHKRMNGQLQEKYKQPMTANQSTGFYTGDKISSDIGKMTSYPISKCPETKYAEEMIKTGTLFS
jgi:hypothetical protein